MRDSTLKWLFAVGCLGCLAGCGDLASGNTTPQDGGGDVTTGNPDGGVPDDGGGDVGIGPGYEAGPIATGDAGEPCTQPNLTCAPGLYCDPTGTCQVSKCAGKPNKALPYAAAADFETVFTIGPEKDNFTIIASGAECDSTTYPPIPDTGLGDGGAAADGAAPDGAPPDASFPTLDDGGVEIVTYAPPPSCYEFLYAPSCLSGSVGLCWAGAEFTNSAATAAAAADGHPSASAVGVCVAPGATAVSFWARSSVAGSIVKFGSSRPGACVKIPIVAPDGGPPDPATEQQACPGATEFYIALTTSWAQYTVSLAAGEAYDDEPGAGGGVWNAFSLVLEPQQFVGGAYVFVKDIVWSNPSASADAGAPDAAHGDAALDAPSDAPATDAPTD
jgi:hypothetical protein